MLRYPVRGNRRTANATLLVLAVALLSAGCGSSGGSKAASTTATNPTTTTAQNIPAAAKLPPDILAAKEIKVGSDVSYAPIEFFKEGTQEVQGLDYDIGQAIGARLGVKVTFVNLQFDGLIPGLAAKRFDMIMSSLTDNKTRQAKLDFVDYFTAGTGILVQKGNPKNITSLEDLCGKTVALEKATTQETVANDQSTKCGTEGKAKITVLSLAKDTDALQQLKIGRSDADLNDFPVAAYNAATSGGGNDFQVVGQQFNSAPYGIAFDKTNTVLRDAIREGLKAIIADGTYDKILAKWQVGAGALKTADINGGTGT